MDSNQSIFDEGMPIIPYVEVEDLPNVVSDLLDDMANFGTKMDNLNDRVLSAKGKAENAKNKADEACSPGVKWVFNKDNIENLQTAMKYSSESVNDVVGIQEHIFDALTGISKVSKGLLLLSTLSIAHHRYVVREVLLRLKGATDKELSELERSELESLWKQLIANRDIQSKIENLSKIIKDECSENEKRASKLFMLEESLEHYKLEYNNELKSLTERVESFVNEKDSQNQTISALQDEICQQRKIFDRRNIIAYAIGGIGAVFGIISLILLVI